MLHLLADITATPEPLTTSAITVLQGLACIAVLAGGGLWALNQWNALTGKKQKQEPRETHISGQPLFVAEHPQYATKAELQALEQKVAGLDGKLDQKFTTLNHERSKSIAGLHTRIEKETDDLRREIKLDVGGVHDRVNEVLKGVARLEGRTER